MAFNFFFLSVLLLFSLLSLAVTPVDCLYVMNNELGRRETMV